jgi:putative peptide zinc metalloprotease protein
MIHEYGHIVAAYYRNMKDLNIYAGFFIIFPTFFTKINDLVTKKFKQRLIVDFGGIYFQIISFIIVYLLCHIYKSDYLELFLSVNLIIISINIIPFYFTDGYWLYSDIFEIENLNVKSSAVLKGILTFNFTNENFKKSTILIYTVFKSILFVAIMIYVIRFLYYQSFYLGDTFYQIKESHGSIIVILRCFLLLLPYILFVLFIFNKLYYGYRKNFRGNH